MAKVLLCVNVAFRDAARARLACLRPLVAEPFLLEPDQVLGARSVAERENILMVPAESLIQRVGGASIYRVNDSEGSEGLVERVAIQVGATDGDYVEVRGSVRPGDRIVRRGHGGLANGMSVVVRASDRPPVATAVDATRGNDS